MKRKRLVICLLLITLSATYPAESFDKVGTTAAQFLQIGVGARLTSMGGAGVAKVEGIEALYWNPGRICENKRFTLGVYYANWIADLRHQFIGVIVPVSEAGAIGFQAISLGGDKYEQTTLTYQEGNGVQVEYSDLALGASYAQRLTDRFSVGGTAKYISQKLFHETASAFAFDLGTNLKTDLAGFSIGMAMTNLGGEMTLEGRDLLTSSQNQTATQYQVSSWPLPLTFQVGFGWRLLGNEEAFCKNDLHEATLVFDGQHINEGLTRWRTGLEYGFKQTVFLRTGHVFEHHTEKWSFGAGLRIPIIAYLIQADFAYADLGDLEAVQRISLQITGR